MVMVPKRSAAVVDAESPAREADNSAPLLIPMQRSLNGAKVVKEMVAL